MTIYERIEQLRIEMVEKGVEPIAEVWEPPFAVLLMFGESLGLTDAQTLKGVDRE